MLLVLLDRLPQISYKLLEQSEKLSQEFEVKSQPTLRITEDVTKGIIRLAPEKQANLIIMGWSEEMGLRSPITLSCSC